MRALCFAALAVAGSCMFLGLQGCAVAKSPSGEYVLGFGVASEPGSASDLAESAGSILGSIGVPGATAIAGGVAALATTLGWGVRKSNRAAELEGTNKGWDERDSHQKAIDNEYYAGQRDAVRAAPLASASVPQAKEVA